MPIYKIRDTETGLFSHGIVHESLHSRKGYRLHQVRFSVHGKEWTGDRRHQEASVEGYAKRC